MVRGLIPRGAVTMITGDGGVGKSLLAQQLLTAAAIGRDFLGCETTPSAGRSASSARTIRTSCIAARRASASIHPGYLRQVPDGVCDKYLTVFSDFKIARSFFDSSLAAVPFTPDPFKIEGTQRRV